MSERHSCILRVRTRLGTMLALMATAALYLSASSPTDVQTPLERSSNQSASIAIKVDQAGYLPHAAKRAMVVSPAGATTFDVRSLDDDEVVFPGTLTAPRLDADSGDRVQVADFSGLDAPGRYRVHVPGVGASWPFEIAASAVDRPLYLALRSFYGQRCGTAVDLGREFPGYRYDVCHRVGQFHPSSGRRGAAPSVKGWHDAGDYGRYVVTTGFAAGTLLLALELYPTRLGELALDLPESRDGRPDLLHEVRWGLDWMLSMQDPREGGVWHKQTSDHFPGFVLPQDDDAASLVAGSGHAPYATTCATAQMAAAMAMAARALRPYDPAYAARALRAAERAWTWTAQHPADVFTNPPDITTGEYGDAECGDERLWAAVEIWRTSPTSDHHRAVEQLAPRFLDDLRATGPPSWNRVGALALWSYALDGRGDPALTAEIRGRALAAAATVAARIEAHPYRQPLTTDDYVWGSNGVAAAYGMQLLVADRLHGSSRFADASADTVHYLLGRNPFSLSWLTGVGAHAVRQPHHRPSGADAQPEPWPGLLAGGPNRHRQDPVLEGLPTLPPARMYADDQASFASNEYAINWNAALVFVLAGVGDHVGATGR